MSARDLRHYTVHNKQIVKVRYENGVVLGTVHIKSDPTCKLELHMNKDEAEKYGIETGRGVEIC